MSKIKSGIILCTVGDAEKAKEKAKELNIVVDEIKEFDFADSLIFDLAKDTIGTELPITKAASKVLCDYDVVIVNADLMKLEEPDSFTFGKFTGKLMKISESLNRVSDSVKGTTVTNVIVM